MLPILKMDKYLMSHRMLYCNNAWNQDTNGNNGSNLVFPELDLYHVPVELVAGYLDESVDRLGSTGF